MDFRTSIRQMMMIVHAASDPPISSTVNKSHEPRKSDISDVCPLAVGEVLGAAGVVAAGGVVVEPGVDCPSTRAETIRRTHAIVNIVAQRARTKMRRRAIELVKDMLIGIQRIVWFRPVARGSG